MRSRFPFLFGLLLSGVLLAPVLSRGAVVFRPKDKYVGSADEEVSGSAQQLFEGAQRAEKSGNLGRALKSYRAIVRKYPKDALAPDAAYRFAILTEKQGDLLKAAAAYRVMVEQYPKSPHFEEAIEAQFRIGETYLNGKKLKILGIPLKSAVDKAVQIFADIVRSAPYGRYTARAQFNIGRATEKQGNAEAAVAAYQAVVEKFPDDPLAADAQYQIGYLWLKTSKSGVRDAKATANAKTAFQDFLYRYPKSEKVAQAKENLRLLDHKQTSKAFQVAKFYDKQKNYRAAVIYYNDVIRQQPGSDEADEAKKRVAELRAKFPEKEFQSAEVTAATAKKPPVKETAALARSGRHGGEEEPGMRTSPSDVAPLPPPELDESLPPPASLSPDLTLAPALPSPTPEATASPEE